MSNELHLTGKIIGVFGMIGLILNLFSPFIFCIVHGLSVSNVGLAILLWLGLSGIWLFIIMIGGILCTLSRDVENANKQEK